MRYGGLCTTSNAADRVGLHLAVLAANSANAGLVAGPAKGVSVMAALLKIGTKWINLDQVMEIQDNVTSLRVYYPVAHGTQNEIDYTEILGSEASALHLSCWHGYGRPRRPRGHRARAGQRDRVACRAPPARPRVAGSGTGPSSDRRTKNGAQADGKQHTTT